MHAEILIIKITCSVSPSREVSQSITVSHKRVHAREMSLLFVYILRTWSNKAVTMNTLTKLPEPIRTKTQ